MSIPLYFAMTWEASDSYTGTHKAQLGFCFHEDGTLSVPNQILSNCPIIINDACLPKRVPEQTTISQIIRLSAYGCILDFERPQSDWSRAFLRVLQSGFPTETFLAVPPAYAPFANHAAVMIPSDAPVNNWTQFCKRQQQIHKRWILEVIPYKICVPQKTKTIRTQTISNAVCICRAENNTVTYYDTFETVLSKLEIAEYYGCIAGIGLVHELEAMKSL